MTSVEEIQRNTSLVIPYQVLECAALILLWSQCFSFTYVRQTGYFLTLCGKWAASSWSRTVFYFFLFKTALCTIPVPQSPRFCIYSATRLWIVLTVNLPQRVNEIKYAYDPLNMQLNIFPEQLASRQLIIIPCHTANILCTFMLDDFGNKLWIKMCIYTNIWVNIVLCQRSVYFSYESLFNLPKSNAFSPVNVRIDIPIGSWPVNHSVAYLLVITHVASCFILLALQQQVELGVRKCSSIPATVSTGDPKKGSPENKDPKPLEVQRGSM